uniref:beta-ketoacyl-[acyl-carrier-protein] synthase I n=2 Tax=Rhodosorus marinus TaxID=101924 RepID=A0A7S2ZAF1_9RHOD|mmetsp:Transcript_11485/g.47796  ORF Transcript_11485/g.47796 Transcript_11485/m.47796 type:complete len:527 (+) Transcript_11485:235-1815(+)
MSGEGDVMERVRALGLCLDDAVVTGVSIGLPSADASGRVQEFSSPFDFERLFEGLCGISALPDEDVNLMLEKNVAQVRKNENGVREKYRLSSPEEVIRIAGRIADFDLGAQHGVPEFILPALDITFKMAISAGLEALKHANICLERNAAGKLLLPEELRDSTGVIFAASFPVLDSLIEEVSKHLRYKLQKQSTREKVDMLRRISKNVESQFPGIAKVILGELESIEKSKEDLSYEFNRKLLFQILVMANSQLAELIGARGPNVDVNAACASSSMGIAIAEDWIRVGRASRVIVVGADNVTSRNMLQYVGTGFLALGAASTKGCAEEAALPFSRKRNGLVLGSGAVGLVIESESAAKEREAVILSRILATRIVNSAYHASGIDTKHVTGELHVLLDRVEDIHGIKREAFAENGIYISHETFTCVNGGCAAVEVKALREGFGDVTASKLLIANTKAFTGHPMGAGIEDAVAVMSLHTGRVPPIPRKGDLDENLGDLNISSGGSHDKSYALRFAAGFGSQCVFIAYGKV